MSSFSFLTHTLFNKKHKKKIRQPFSLGVTDTIVEDAQEMNTCYQSFSK
jgi:hypothetical protein